MPNLPLDFGAPQYVQRFARQLNGFGAQVNDWSAGVDNWVADNARNLYGLATPGENSLQMSSSLDVDSRLIGSIALSRDRNWARIAEGITTDSTVLPTPVNYYAGFTGDGFRIGVSWGFQSSASNSVNPLAWGGGLSNGIGFNNLAELGQWVRGVAHDFSSLIAGIGSGIGHIFSAIGSFIRHIFPVVLDLDGDGVKIAPLTSSNRFFDMAGDGYQHRTAWAGAGDAVLAYDANNDGRIDQKNEIVFTEWDPSASSDMQALRNVFDTNQNGALDSGDAQFSQFKLIVSNADGTQTVKTLAQAANDNGLLERAA